jgi:hypothetical protein
MNEMQTLENMKKGLPEGTSKDDHRYPIENFVTSMFTNADKDERTCDVIERRKRENERERERERDSEREVRERKDRSRERKK